MAATPASPLTQLTGVEVARLVQYGDQRGAFAELWRAESTKSLTGLPAVQANLSASAAGVLRGMHVHRRQIDRWIVLEGVAFVALVDIRPRISRPEKHPIVAAAVMTTGETVNIPEGVAHGFLALEPLKLLYFVTNAYDGTDELGFKWDDPAVAIQWPKAPTADGRPILSDRDRSNPTLDELVAGLQG